MVFTSVVVVGEEQYCDPVHVILDLYLREKLGSRAGITSRRHRCHVQRIRAWRTQTQDQPRGQQAKITEQLHGISLRNYGYGRMAWKYTPTRNKNI